MNGSSQLRECASEIVEATRRFEAAAHVPGSYPGALDSLEALEEAFQLMSAAWYRLAADTSPDFAERGSNGVSREQEVRLLATLHEIAARFARTARTCRTGRAKVAPIIERRASAAREVA